MKSEKGITLISLTVTIIVMLILIVVVSVNLEPYKNEAKRTSFEADMRALREEVEQYYAINKKLPIINKYTYTAFIDENESKNDNNNYYVIDIRKIDVELKFGSGFKNVLSQDRDTVISGKINNLDCLDVYIINEQSHKIYYPKGIEYNGIMYYTLNEYYNDAKAKIEDKKAPKVDIILEKSEKLFGIKATIEISDKLNDDDFSSGIDYSKCRYMFTQSATITEDKTDFTNHGKPIYIEKTEIEEAIGPSNNWYLHVLAIDNAGNEVEVVSNNSINIEEAVGYGYNSSEQIRTVNLLAGKYKLECWGAQGGTNTSTNGSTQGGFGGYSTGIINLSKTTNLYIMVGQAGNSGQAGSFPYNGGGRGDFGGGGATHIALSNHGTINNYGSYLDDLLIVAGGGRRRY